MLSRFQNPTLKSFVVVSKDRLNTQIRMWKAYLPWIKPYYAVKSNNDKRLMAWMIDAYGPHMGFDCASISEMQEVRSVSKTSPIVYAQPCKTKTDINDSLRFGVRTTVVDSPEEMDKMGQAGWKGDVLIRLLVPDNNSRQPFSKKFGAPVQWFRKFLSRPSVTRYLCLD